MDYFTQKDREWFEKAKRFPEQFRIIIDNDAVWIDDIFNGEDDATTVYTFNSYGYQFIHALLKDMDMNCEYC